MRRIIVIFFWDVLYRVFSVFPLEKKVFFESFLGKDYSDSPKVLHEYLVENDYDYKYIWSLRGEKEKIVPNAKVVKKMSLVYCYHLATSKYIINNSRMPLRWRKRKNQIYLQTWHGTPLKRLVYDMENVTLPKTNKEKYLINFSKDINKWDYLVSPNEYSTNTFKRAFRYNGKIIESGYPRSEELYSYSQEEVMKIKKQLNLDLKKKVILYAPTFRDNKFIDKGHFIQEIKINMKKIKEFLQEDVILVVKNHYLVKKVDYLYGNLDIIDLSDYENINDLYKISDLLVTDYSSVFFEYMILNKPILFYQYDQKEYKDDIRGFYIPLEDLPGEVATNESELYNALMKINLSNDEVNYTQFTNKYKISNIDKSASKIIIKQVIGEK